MQGELPLDLIPEMVEEGPGAREASELQQRLLQVGILLRHPVVQVQLLPQRVSVHPRHWHRQGDAEHGGQGSGPGGQDEGLSQGQQSGILPHWITELPIGGDSPGP